jgi:hypothetical protein
MKRHLTNHWSESGKNLTVGFLQLKRKDCSITGPAVGQALDRHDATRMTLAEDEQMVEILSPHDFHRALRNRFCSRRLQRRQDLRNAEVPQPAVECRTIASAAIVNEKSWWLSISSIAFDHLLSRPHCRRTCCHRYVRNFSVDVPTLSADRWLLFERGSTKNMRPSWHPYDVFQGWHRRRKTIAKFGHDLERALDAGGSFTTTVRHIKRIMGGRR